MVGSTLGGTIVTADLTVPPCWHKSGGNVLNCIFTVTHSHFTLISKSESLILQASAIILIFFIQLHFSKLSMGILLRSCDPSSEYLLCLPLWLLIDKINLIFLAGK